MFWAVWRGLFSLYFPNFILKVLTLQAASTMDDNSRAEKQAWWNSWGHWSCWQLIRNLVIYTLGLTLWNLSCLEFKFYDTRLSYWHKNKIGRIEISFCCFLTLLIFCPFGLLSFAKTANRAYVNRKVWYHQILIPTNLRFMVLILIYITSWSVYVTSIYTVDIYRYKFIETNANTGRIQLPGNPF